MGVVDVSVSCLGALCTVVWESSRRSPVEAGGHHSSRGVEVEVDRGGRWEGGKLRVTEDGAARPTAGIRGAVPATVAEILLARAVPLPPRSRWQGPPPSAPERCIEIFEETGGGLQEACVRRDGEAIRARVRGVAERIEPGADGFPRTISIEAQGARFVRDPEATVPRRAPQLYGVAVPGPGDPSRAASFCGLRPDPVPDPEGLGFLPPPRAPGESCMEKTAAWLSLAGRTGAPGRTAVGVAWDGTRFVWHAWAEVRTSRGWIPIDPSFEELPARGPRFTVSTFEEGDERARLAAGDRILACWGRERVRER